MLRGVELPRGNLDFIFIIAVHLVQVCDNKTTILATFLGVRNRLMVSAWIRRLKDFLRLEFLTHEELASWLAVDIAKVNVSPYCREHLQEKTTTNITAEPFSFTV